MVLPPNYASAEQYFQEASIFFEEYQQLYKHPNTDILVNGTLDHIKINNLENIDLSIEKFDLRDLKDDYLERFFEKLDRLTPVFNDFVEDLYVDDVLVALSQKKRHEIIHLAKEIENVCQLANCDTVVDFGSGLGYLDQRLYDTSNYKVLGVECNEGHYVAAKKRQRKYHEHSIDHVKYIRHKVKSSSCGNIEEYLQDKFGSPNFCITGLHACADLAVDAINIFLNMAAAKCLVLMPCCYHKMEEIDGKFTNFPLSNCLRSISEKYHSREYMNVPFLRLGAQPPNWKDEMEDLIFNLLSRAVLQIYAHKLNCKLKRNKRKAVKLRTLKNDFDNYTRDALSGFSLITYDTHENIELNLEEIKRIWEDLPDLTFKSTGILILQNCMQKVLENFILYDRIVYLRENGVDKCKLRKIFDDNISPRCLALIAFK